MKKYINTSNYYLSTTTSKIENTGTSGTFDVSDVTVDWVTLPLTGYYWVDVDFGDSSKREIFRIVSRSWYTLTYDDRISPYGMKTHQSWASVGLRDFSQLLNSLSTNTDNFWEVEKTWDLSILVRGGNVFLSGSAKADTWVKEISSSQFDLQANTVTYIVVDIDKISYSFMAITNTDYLLDEWQYPIAKITTWVNAINEIKDLRSTMIGGWDMRSAVYDPEWKRRELYLMDNMEQSIDWQHLFVTQAQVDLWNSYQQTKQEKLISWQNIVTINGKSIIDVSQWEGWNIPLDTILTAGWHMYVTEDWVSTFTFDNQWLPLTEDAFMVFTDSGTALIRGWENPNDYTYDDATHTITFNYPLYEDEHAIIWTMFDNTDAAVWIGSWVITLQRNWTTITNWQFNVNQEENQTIELWDLASNAQITFTQWWVPDKTITLNQASNDTVALSWIIPVSQEDYEDLPDTKLTDNQWYFIIE